MEPVLELVNITKRFPGIIANDHISLDLRQGEVLALLGENGAGKTTLMNILYGFLRPDEGEIRVRGQVCSITSPREAIEHGIGMVHQHFMLVPNLTVTENIILGQEPVRAARVQRKEAAEEIARLSAAYCLEVSPHKQIWELSVGEQQRVEILKVLYRGVDILVLDEPTASLTPQEAEALFDVLRSMTQQGKSVILISHKLEEVLGVSDRVTVLRRGKVIGTVDTPKTSDTELARMMVGRDVVLRVTGAHTSQQEKRCVANLEDITAAGYHSKPALEHLDLELFGGEILGVAGVDGNGQTELAELIAGLRRSQSGKLTLAGQVDPAADPLVRMNLGVYYVPAERKKRGAVMDLPLHVSAVLKNHRQAPFSRLGVLNHPSIRQFTQQQIVDEYDIRCASIDIPAGALSGGNLQKLILAREISGQPSLLIAEQPTRGLDVGAIEFVRGLLLRERERGASILLISADLDEILALSDRIIVLYEGKILFTCANDDQVCREDIGLAMAGTMPGAMPCRQAGGAA